MYRRARSLQAFGLAFVFGATVTLPASATILSFNGTGSATATPFADPGCAPLPFRAIIPLSDGSGTSNLGSFSYSQNVCTQGATGPVTGGFSFDFGTSSFSGLLNGMSVARVGTPGLFDQMFTYVLTGGTGRFAGATGSFTNIGTVDVRRGLPSRLTFNFDGTIDASAVPEPTTWVTMIFGFGLLGAAMRRREDHVLA